MSTHDLQINTKTSGVFVQMLPTANQRRPEPKSGPFIMCVLSSGISIESLLGCTGAHGYTSEQTKPDLFIWTTHQ